MDVEFLELLLLLKTLETMRTPAYKLTDSKNDIVTIETDSTLLGCLCVMRFHDINTLVISDDLISIDLSQTSSLRVISMVDIVIYLIKLREKEMPTEIFTEFKVQNFIDDMKLLPQIPVFPSSIELKRIIHIFAEGELTDFQCFVN